MRKLKAPGPDSFQVGFFQEYWDIVGSEVIGAIRDFFNNNSPLNSINQTFIALIPKIKIPKAMSNFRLISLYNAFYKIIAKTMANRMK